MKNKTTIIAVVIIIIVIAGFLVYAKRADSGPGKYDEFATCLKDSGAIFYGTFWCPHCQNQKKDFGKSADLLPYVECSTPDGSDQLPVCTEAGITSYPSWVFADGSKEVGRLTFSKLSEKTGCPLPE